MTEDTAPTPEATEPEKQDTPPETPTEPQAASRQAAAYRTRLRDSEARIAALQRREVDRLSGAQLAQPGDLFDIAGVALADLCDADGNVDAEKVTTAAEALLSSRPGLAKPRPHYPDYGAGNRGTPPRSQPTGWGQVIGRNRR